MASSNDIELSKCKTEWVIYVHWNGRISSMSTRWKKLNIFIIWVNKYVALCENVWAYVGQKYVKDTEETGMSACHWEGAPGNLLFIILSFWN